MKTLLTALLAFTTTCLMAQEKELITVHFDFNKHNITKATAMQLDSFVATKNAQAFLGIYGHCDSVGNNDYNDELSYKRVIAVKKYLISKGLSSDNIKQQIGFGKRSPLNKNISDHERAMNRRVEIIINDDRDIEENNEASTVKKIQADRPTLTETIEDTFKIKPGMNVVMKNMNFYGGRSLILPSSYAVLTELLQVMKSNPTLEVAIEGHVCCIPTTGDGLDIDSNTVNLSETRAKAVYNFLVQNNIKPERLSYKGMAHQYPLKAFPETTEVERSNNRRVEIRIIKR